MSTASCTQVNHAFIAEDVREDFEEGLEYAEASEIMRMVQRGDQRQYLIRSAGAAVAWISTVSGEMVLWLATIVEVPLPSWSSMDAVVA
jgi:hypothetical protein